MKNNSPETSGQEILSYLEVEAPTELKRARQYVEDAVFQDIHSYLMSAGSEQIPPNVLSGLTTAAIAGGQWGFNSLVTRMESANLRIKDFDLAANEILMLISQHTTVLNFARIKATAVQSITKSLFGSMDTSMNRTAIDKLFKSKIVDQATLAQWGKDAEKLFHSLAVSAGQVSQRSVSTYSKLWNSYLEEKILPKLGIKVDLKSVDSVSERVRYLKDYKKITPAQIKKVLAESDKRSNFSTRQSNSRKSSAKLIKYERDLGGRTLTISYNSPGVNPDLIQPVLNSVKGQIIINPKQPTLLVNMSIDDSQIIVELEKPKKEDVDTLKLQLGSLVARI